MSPKSNRWDNRGGCSSAGSFFRQDMYLPRRFQRAPTSILKFLWVLKSYYNYVCDRPEVTFLITFQTPPRKLKMVQPLSGQLISEMIYCQSVLRVRDLESKKIFGVGRSELVGVELTERRVADHFQPRAGARGCRGLTRVQLWPSSPSPTSKSKHGLVILTVVIITSISWALVMARNYPNHFTWMD